MSTTRRGFFSKLAGLFVGAAAAPAVAKAASEAPRFAGGKITGLTNFPTRLSKAKWLEMDELVLRRWVDRQGEPVSLCWDGEAREQQRPELEVHLL